MLKPVHHYVSLLQLTQSAHRKYSSAAPHFRTIRPRIMPLLSAMKEDNLCTLPGLYRARCLLYDLLDQAFDHFNTTLGEAVYITQHSHEEWKQLEVFVDIVDQTVAQMYELLSLSLISLLPYQRTKQQLKTLLQRLYKTFPSFITQENTLDDDWQQDLELWKEYVMSDSLRDEMKELDDIDDTISELHVAATFAPAPDSLWRLAYEQLSGLTFEPFPFPEWFASVDDIVFTQTPYWTGAIYHYHNGTYAGRAVVIEALSSREHRQAFDIDVYVRTNFGHPNIIQFLYACHVPPKRCIVTERPDYSCLSAFLDVDSVIPLPILLHLLMDAATGIAFLHKHGLVHGQVTGDNLTISRLPNGGYRAKWRYSSAMVSKSIDHEAGSSWDVYSFGKCMIEMFNGSRLPMDDIPLKPEAMPGELWTLVLSTHRLNPKERPSMNIVLEVLESVLPQRRPSTPMEAETTEYRQESTTIETKDEKSSTFIDISPATIKRVICCNNVVAPSERASPQTKRTIVALGVLLVVMICVTILAAFGSAKKF